MRVIPARPDHDSALAASLVALQQRAYAVEASLIGDNRIPLLQQNVAELAQHAWAGWSPSTMLVESLERSLGPATRSTPRSTAWSSNLRCTDEAPVGRCSAQRSIPSHSARLLYKSFGFIHCTDTEALPGLWTARYAYL